MIRCRKMEQTRHYYLNEAAGYARVEGFSRAGTDQRNGVSFDQKEGSAVAGWIGGDEFGAHAHVARHARNYAEWRRTRRCGAPQAWRGRAGLAFVRSEPGVADETTADSLVVDRHVPRPDGQPRQVKAPRNKLLADSGPEPPGDHEPTDQGTDGLNGPARRPDRLKDGLDIHATDAD